MYVSMFACMFVNMYVCMYIYKYVCMYVCMYVYVCMYACMFVNMYVCMYVNMYVCMYVCMYYPPHTPTYLQIAYSPSLSLHDMEEMASEEVTAGAVVDLLNSPTDSNSKIQIRNVYFESVPLHQGLVTVFVNEEGPMEEAREVVSR